MLRIGLTGGIGCGKSTVAAMMGEAGCHIINADQIAHASLSPGGPGYDEIVREFGTEIVLSDGTVERARLAAIVFADPQRLARLNAIVHPRVLAKIGEQLDAIQRSDPNGIAVVEAALLIESGYHLQMDGLVLVSCTPEQQLERLTDPRFGRNMSREDAQGRIAAQMPWNEKRKLAHDEIDCSGTLEQTREQVIQLVARWKAMAAQNTRQGSER